MSATDVIDGSVLAYEIISQGCRVTIAGNNERAVLVFFDKVDLFVLRSMADRFFGRGAT